MTIILGIDIGTTGCKVCAYDASMRRLSSAYSEYPLIFASGFVELDSDLVFRRVCDCISRATSQLDRSNIVAISVSSMTDTFTPFGFDGRPLMNSIVSFDRRASAEASVIEKAFGKEELFNITGLPIHSMYPGCKILWINKNVPDIAQRTWKYLSYEDFILWKLGAPAVSSYSMIGKSLLFDIRSLQYHPDLVSACGARLEQLPLPVCSGTDVGHISPEIARDLNFSPDVRLVSGGFDQACCALAFGIVKPGNILNTIGTNEIIYFPLKQEQSKNLFNMNMNFSCHVMPGGYGSYAQIFNAGGALRWCRDTFFTYEKANRPDIYDFITSHCHREPENITFLPFLSGIGTPDMDTRVDGAFCGIRLGVDRFSLAQSIIEGITCEFKYNLDIIAGIIGNKPEHVTVVGGGSNSGYWMQLKSDMLAIEVDVPENVEPGTAGAAILAGAAFGIFDNCMAGASAFEKNLKYKRYFPDSDIHASFSGKIKKYNSFRNIAQKTKGFKNFL